MKIYLMQHALACPAEDNPERPLSQAGIEQAKAAARGIKSFGLSFDLIVTSPKRRAQQTAALVAEAVRYPYSDILTTAKVQPDQNPQALLDQLQQEPPESSILVVGHMPHLAKLAGLLLQGGELHMENAGLTCLEISTPNRAVLEFHLQAEHLAR